MRRPSAPRVWHSYSSTIAVQWEKTSEFPFPNLTGPWTAMDNQDPWEPTLPTGYT